MSDPNAQPADVEPGAGALLAIALPAQGVGLAVGRVPPGSTAARPGLRGSFDVDSLAEYGGDRQSGALLPAIDRLLESCHVPRDALTGICFEAGPGGFTRIRVACAVAQGLGFGLGVPVAGIDSLHAAAYAATERRTPPVGGATVFVLADARMGEAYAAAFALRPAEPLRGVVDARLVPIGEVASWIAAATPSRRERWLLSDASERVLQATAGVGGVRLPWPDPARLAEAVLLLARAEGRWQWARDARPRYLRDKVALDVDEQAAARVR